MNKEIRLGIGVAVLCIALFLLVIGIGNSNKGKENNPFIGDSATESTEVVDTELVETEVVGTEVDGDKIEEENSEYLNFAIADVSDYVNVRQEPNTDSAILGKIYDGAVAQILQTVGEGDNQWFQIVSGNVEGYIKAEFFIHGADAEAVSATRQPSLAAAGTSSIEEIKQYKELLDAGIITEEEFSIKKRQLLGL